MGRLLLAAAVLVAAVAQSPAASGKTVRGNAQLEAGDLYTGPEKEITKFSFSVGKGLVRGTFRYEDPHTWMTSPALYLFMDERWDEYHSAPACDDKMEFAHASIPIGRLTRSHTDVLHSGLGKATKSEVNTGRDGMVEWTFEWEIEHHVRTHGWFLVLADCALEQFNTQVPPMDYEIQLFNDMTTHLPADEQGVPRFILGMFVALCLFLAWALTLLVKHYQEAKTVHLVVRLLLSAFVLQLLSMLMELVHLWQYKSDGFGLFWADLLSEMLEGFSQSVIAFVLICLASGWTLVEVEHDDAKANSVATLLRNPKRLVTGANPVILVIVLVVVLSMVLQVLNKNEDDNFSKFHDYESTPGKLLVLLRFTLGLAFVVSLHVTIRHQVKRGGDRLISFLRRLMLLGGLWFLAFPLLVFSAGFFAHYLRHRVVTGGVLLLQSVCLCLLSYEFLSHSSTYFKLSSLADSGVLPGAGGLVASAQGEQGLMPCHFTVCVRASSCICVSLSSFLFSWGRSPSFFCFCRSFFLPALFAPSFLFFSFLFLSSCARALSSPMDESPPARVPGNG